MKKFLSCLLLLCLLFSLSGCAYEKEIDPIEGKFYYENNNEYYIEFKKDNTYEMCTRWGSWLDEKGKVHEICTGTYKVYKGIKETDYVDYIAVFFTDEVKDSKNWLWSDYVNFFIVNENKLSECKDAHEANYIKA